MKSNSRPKPAPPVPTTTHRPPLLTVQEVALILHFSPRCVYEVIYRKELRVSKINARWRIDPRDLERFIKEHIH